MNPGPPSASTAVTLILPGIVSGTGDLAKVGAGTLNLLANNTYTGNTVVNGGTLALRRPGNALTASDFLVNPGRHWPWTTTATPTRLPSTWPTAPPHRPSVTLKAVRSITSPTPPTVSGPAEHHDGGRTHHAWPRPVHHPGRLRHGPCSGRTATLTVSSLSPIRVGR